MSSPLPPDPYEALGVTRDATATAIKTAHRKLVLKCHPDKVTDPAEKENASDKFHRIQTAYEILIDGGRRERYDAQVRLAELKKEALGRQSEVRARGADVRPSYRSSQETPLRGSYVRSSERVVPQTEERRPSYANDYFDSQPRATTRKEPEYAERTSRHTTPQPSKEKEKPRGFFSSRSSRDSERERRKEKTKAAERDTRREREKKYTAHVEDEESDSDLGEYEQRSRRMREEDDARRAREQPYSQPHRPQREPDYSHYDRAGKMHTQYADAREYITASSRATPRTRLETEQRRPSLNRMTSARDARVEQVKYGDGQVRYVDGRPAGMVRRASHKPGKDTKETSRKNSSRTPERKSSEDHVRPPPLHSSKSSPAEIRLPAAEKQRAASSQSDSDAMPIPGMRRAETMPYKSSGATKSSRATEFVEGQPTPATTPENQEPFPLRHSYGHKYADDVDEAAAPGVSKAESRESGAKAKDRPYFARKFSRSPSPVRDDRNLPRDTTRETTRARDIARDAPRDARESRDPRAKMQRAATSVYERPQPSRPNTRTTSYMYGGPDRGMVDRDTRAYPSREPSPRDVSYLYGEVRPSTGSPRSRQSPHAAPDENVRYSKPSRAEEVKMATGYQPRRSSGTRPAFGRSGSGNPVSA